MKRNMLFAAGVLLAAGIARGQSLLDLPEASPAASTMQTIGITDVEVRYHRPAVSKRKIWDGLVPFGVVWRAGANEGTTLSFSTPVSVEGKPVDPGTYGLFMVPGASRWTVALSRFPGGWGTYSYETAEDVTRVEVSPQPLSESLREGAPSTVTDRLVPRLEVMDPVRKEDREARGDHEVVGGAMRVFNDPVPLVLRHHLPPSLDHEARGARVQDEQT